MPRDHRRIEQNRQLSLGAEGTQGKQETLGPREPVAEPASSWSSSWALSSSRFLALNLTLLALTIGALAATAFSASYLLSGVRAYVGGEGLWSKGEKDAAFHLTSYLISHREEDYRDALTALAAPLGDHRARLALDRPRIDRAEITAGFRAGRNDRDDTEALTWLYLHCRRVEAFDRAVRLWQLGDRYILRLRDLAQQIHDESAGRGISPQRQEVLRREIDDINRAVTVLEDDFSFTLGNLARRVHRLVVFLVLVTAGLLFAGACFVSLGYARRLRQEEAQLASSERRYRTLVETSNDLIWSVDADGRWTFVNQVAQRIYDQQPGEMLGHRFTDFQTPAQAAKDWKQLASIVGGQPGARFETVHLRRDGTPVHLSINAVALFDGNGNVIGATGTAADITDRKRAESVIEFQAYHDSLTGLPNRTLFLERLKQALAVAQRREAELAIFFIDLDRFKLVNDTLGHLAGDRLLQRVAERLRMALRQDDVVARLGGDEFVVLLQSHSRVEGAVKVAQKLLDRLSEPFDVEGHSLQVTTSIGISVFPTDGTDAETLLGSADLALYLAKEQGRNGYQLCTSAMKERAQHRLALEGELHRALERQEFEVYYQPVVSLQDGSIGSLEALVRWRHPLEGMIPPAQFIPLAEELRLVIPIGDWVLRTACRQVNLWHARGLPSLRVAINLSPCHFEQDDAARSLIKTLRESDFDPASTEIEITESAALRDIPRTVAVLERLRSLGVRISMDDFGAGQTSLANLRRFPLDTLKIDRDLTSSIGKVEGGEAIFSAVVSMAHGLQLRAVAEGVETERQLRFLRDCGCDAYQGFLHSRPMPADAVEEMLLHQRTAIAV